MKTIENIFKKYGLDTDMYKYPQPNDWATVIKPTQVKISIDDVFRTFKRKEILDAIPLEELDLYVREKKIQRLKKRMSQK